jgi:hypothetical protein
MKLRRFLRAGLWAGGVLLVAMLVAVALWLVLAQAGDQAGSQGAKGVALVALVGLIMDFVLLVVLLTLAEITRAEADSRPTDLAPIEDPPR